MGMTPERLADSTYCGDRVKAALGPYFEEARKEVLDSGNQSICTMVVVAIERVREAYSNAVDVIEDDGKEIRQLKAEVSRLQEEVEKLQSAYLDAFTKNRRLEARAEKAEAELAEAKGSADILVNNAHVADDLREQAEEQRDEARKERDETINAHAADRIGIQDFTRIIDQRDAALAVLREVEWSVNVLFHRWDKEWLRDGAYVELGACPACDGICPDSEYAKNLRPELVGHKEGCKIAALLASEEKK